MVDKSGAELGDAAYGLINPESNPIAAVVGTGEAISQTLPGGYYVIVDTYTNGDDVAEGDSISRTMVSLVADETITPKDTTIRPDKKIEENNQEVDTNEASIGDTITYKLSGLVPDMQDFKVFKFVFVDTMSKGLTPNVEEGELLKGTLNGEEKEDMFKVTSLVKNEDGTTTIRIALLNAIDYKDKKGQTVAVNISATLNKDAVITANSNDNNMKIDYSNNPNYDYSGEPDFEPNEPTGQTPEIKVKTFTTSLTITKNDGNGKILEGAEFELTSTNSAKIGYVTGKEYVPYSSVQNYTGDKWYKLVDGAYTKTEPTADTANKYADEEEYALVDINIANYDSQKTSLKAFVDATGQVTFTGLGVGDYKLVETTTPDGYNTIGEITFKVTWTKEDGFRVSDVTEGVKISVAGVGEDGKGVGTILSTTIKNEKGSLLPSTGGIGTTIFYIIGGILVIGAGIILVVKKRMSQE